MAIQGGKLQHRLLKHLNQKYSHGLTLDAELKVEENTFPKVSDSVLAGFPPPSSANLFSFLLSCGKDNSFFGIHEKLTSAFCDLHSLVRALAGRVELDLVSCGEGS